VAAAVAAAVDEFVMATIMTSGGDNLCRVVVLVILGIILLLGDRISTVINVKAGNASSLLSFSSLGCNHHSRVVMGKV